MKGILFLLLIILIDFSYEMRRVECPPSHASVCGCFSCFCLKKPKCLAGQKPECRSGPMPKCFCVNEEKKNTN